MKTLKQLYKREPFYPSDDQVIFVDTPYLNDQEIDFDAFENDEDETYDSDFDLNIK